MASSLDSAVATGLFGQRRPMVLGILNVTPDSFSDGGLYLDADRAVARAEEMLAEGADMVDVGGASSRPGADPVDEATELGRVMPVIERLAGRCRLSIDTERSAVARAAVAAGADVVNDISASLWPVAAETGAGWIAIHRQGDPRTMQRRPSYTDVVTEVRDFLVDRAEQARRAGVEEIWIDPGFGFGKTLDHNLDLLANLATLVDTGWPVAVGTSRKSMIGQLLAASDQGRQVGAAMPDRSEGSVPPDDRLVGSVVTATYAMLQGAELVRVHDVKAAKQAATVVAGEAATGER